MPVGVGTLKHESDSLGAQFEGRGRYADESISVMKALWTQQEPAFEGEHFSFSGIKFSPKGTIRADAIRADAIKTTLYTSGGTKARALAKTNKWATFPDLAKNFTLKGASNVLVFYQVTMAGGDSHLVTRLVVDNAVQRHGRSITGNTTYWSNSNIWIGGLSKGSHTIKVQYRTPKGGTNSPATNWQNRVLKVLVFGA